MRQTAGWKLTVPSAGTDPDDIPTHLGNFGDQLDGLLGSSSGTFSGRPAAGLPGQLYFVTSGTNVGILYRWNATTNNWDQVNIGAGIAGDTTTIGWGDTPNPGSVNRFAMADHKHGSQTNPVIAHVAASNPHPQYAPVTSRAALVPNTPNWNGNNGSIARSDNVVTWDFTAQRQNSAWTPSSSYDIGLATIPSGLRSPYPMFFVGVTNAPGARPEFRFNTDGTVDLRNTGDANVGVNGAIGLHAVWLIV